MLIIDLVLGAVTWYRSGQGGTELVVPKRYWWCLEHDIAFRVVPKWTGTERDHPVVPKWSGTERDLPRVPDLSSQRRCQCNA